MRARCPDIEDFVECAGVKIGYEVHGNGAPTVLLLPTWTIIHSRFWKMQVPYLARRHRVVTFDRPGNGRSDRPADPTAYAVPAVVDQALAVMDATATERAIVVSLSQGAQESLKLAADHPERVLGAVFIGSALTLDPMHPGRDHAAATFLEPRDADAAGWERLNAHYWSEHYDKFVEFFFGECFPEPHSTKQREDCIGWAHETAPEVLLTDTLAIVAPDEVMGWAERVTAPTLVIHGDDDRISPLARGEAIASATGGELAVLEGSGHIPLARDPVRVNLLINDFIDRVAGAQRAAPRWTRGRARAKRVLYLSSPIGLGHARRDVAIAGALRTAVPDVEIEWLAQHPVTRVLADTGEYVHPASRDLASESAHLESESGDHDLHCFKRGATWTRSCWPTSWCSTTW